MRDISPYCDFHSQHKETWISYTTTPLPPKDLMSADSYVMCIPKANIQHYFVNVSVQRRKAVIAMQCPLVESKHKADVFHFSLYLQPFIGSNHKDGVPLTFLSLLSPFYTLQCIDNKSSTQSVKSDSN